MPPIWGANEQVMGPLDLRAQSVLNLMVWLDWLICFAFWFIDLVDLGVITLFRNFNGHKLREILGDWTQAQKVNSYKYL